ncbi:MAG: hypothetical protein NC489_32140 [Ruminococcus flavefaciens]|nr:hypothetical protein [Ruminococcus flavefaciens]
MIDFEFEEYCCGCQACQNICPVRAIEMRTNKEGFWFPAIKKEICINCGAYSEVCVHLNRDRHKENNGEVKASWIYSSLDKQAKMRSSSGSAFYEIAKSVLCEGGGQSKYRRLCMER